MQRPGHLGPHERAIARSLVAIIAIAIIVVAAGVYYVSTYGGGSRNSQGTSSPLLPPLLGGIGDIIGNFSQMKVAFQITSNSNASEGVSSNGTLDYKVVGSVLNGSTKLTEVNLISAETSNGVTTIGSFLVYYNSTWGATTVTFEGRNYTNSRAQSFAQGATLYFDFAFALQKGFLENATAFSQLAVHGTTTTEMFGNVPMSITTYVESRSGSSFEAQLGAVSGKNFSVLTYVDGIIRESGINETYEYRLISATLASP